MLLITNVVQMAALVALTVQTTQRWNTAAPPGKARETRRASGAPGAYRAAALAAVMAFLLFPGH